ncbi:MAG: YihY/virulence factor BrkB family protein [Candidatus Nanopelagicales bacterium]|nr:YihY/virulence factor BrkB family protein [Candidatus Nanopelagicales bacterium]
MQEVPGKVGAPQPPSAELPEGAGPGHAPGGADPRLTPDPQPFYEPWRDPGRTWQTPEPATSHSGVALEVERRVLGVSRWVDRAQSRWTPVAFGYAVFKKYADDEGSRLAALLAYYTFLSLFPLAIGGIAVLNLFLADRPELVAGIIDQAVPEQYQAQLLAAYESLPSGGAGLWVALVGLLLAGTGGVFSAYAMVNQVFAVPYRFRYGFGPRYLVVLLLVLLLGIGVLVVAIGSAVVATIGDAAFVQRLGGFVLVWAVAFGVLLAAPRALARRRLALREYALGAALGAVAMTLFLSLGSVVVSRFIADSSAVYGVFATVVGIISVLFLVSNAIVFCYEISVVRAWQLWPRGVDIMLLFPADERAYALLTLMDERMPSQRNGVAFDATGHDDPRRADPALLRCRPEGVPRRPYDAGTPASGGEEVQP